MKKSCGFHLKGDVKKMVTLVRELPPSLHGLALILILLPGSFFLLPLWAWWLDHRLTRTHLPPSIS